MRERLSGLARRLIAYAVMIAAVIILLRIVIGGLIGFIHMLVLMAVFVFAIYAFFWARRFKSRT
ncbi:MAG: hypothetical protein WKF94_16500 [Solirubrobacteraceae bacterium]